MMLIVSITFYSCNNEDMDLTGNLRFDATSGLSNKGEYQIYTELAGVTVGVNDLSSATAIKDGKYIDEVVVKDLNQGAYFLKITLDEYKTGYVLLQITGGKTTTVKLIGNKIIIED